MKKKSLAFGFFLFILTVSPLSGQVVIRDSIAVGRPLFPVPHASEVRLPPVWLVDPATGRTDTLAPREVIREWVSEDGVVEKAVPFTSAGITTRYHVVFTARYWVDACPGIIIEKQYQIPIALITHAPGSDHSIDVLWTDFDHPWDRLYYDVAGPDMIYFFLIKMLESPCEVYEMCQIQHPDDPDQTAMVYLNICEIADTSVPATQTEDLGERG